MTRRAAAVVAEVCCAGVSAGARGAELRALEGGGGGGGVGPGRGLGWSRWLCGGRGGGEVVSVARESGVVVATEAFEEEIVEEIVDGVADAADDGPLVPGVR